MATLDPELVAAVRKTKGETAKELQHQRQLRKQASRYRREQKLAQTKSQLRSQERTSKVQNEQELINAKAAGQASVIQAREAARAQRMQEMASARRSSGSSRGITNSGGVFDSGSAINKAVTLNPNANLFLVVIFMMFGLIVFYRLVVNPNQTNAYTSYLSNFLHKVSSTTPFFQSVVA